MFISDQGSFLAFLSRARSSSVLAIDTEFLREKTYYPKLCLLQMASDTEIAIVDPFKVRDLTPMQDILLDENVVKLFHAGDQDLEILLRETDVLPSPLFDTQRASAVLGHMQQIGYAALVHARCGVVLRKADSFTDWSRRPLSRSQLSYAADDVRYLPQLYHELCAELSAKGRLHWLDHEFAEMSDASRFRVNPRERYKRLKHVGRLSCRQLSAARELAAWRETSAQVRNLPRKWVLSDEQIVETCKREPATIDQLFMVRGIKERLRVSDAREVVKVVQRGLNAPEDTWPRVDVSPKAERNVDVEVDALNALVRLRARENDIAFQTLVAHDELVKLARGYREGLGVLTGWRRRIVGDELLDFLDGKLSLCCGQGGIEVREAAVGSLSSSGSA